MADVSDDDNETNVKDNKITGFKCCVKKSCNVTVCINCYAIYHNSCLARNGKIKRKIDETKIECCVPDNKVAGMSVNNNNDEILRMEKSKMNMEIEYLKRMVEELVDKNNILKQNNELLVEQNSNLKTVMQNQNNQKTYKDVYLNCSSNSKPVNEKQTTVPLVKGNVEVTNRTKRNVNKTPIRIDLNNSSDSESENNDRRTSINRRGDQNKNNFAGTEASSNSLRPPRRRGNMNNNVVSERSPSVPNTNDHESFQFQRNQRQRFKKRLGNANVSPEGLNTGFSGGERRTWLYLNRIKRHVSEAMVWEHIRSKPGFENENVCVKEIPTEPNRLKCFVVIAPLSRKDELYAPSFWPQNVGIKRFIFEKHRDFLQNAGDFF